MPAYGITITDTATPLLSKLASSSPPPGLFKAAGEAGQRILRLHFSAKQQGEAHRSAEQLGAKSTGLFADFGRATNWQEAPSGILLQVSDVAARQRYYGGVIRPVSRTFLTMPANAYAYGKRAREVGVTLKFMFAEDPHNPGTMRPALVAPDAVTKGVGKARKDGTRRQRVIRPGGVYYWLIRQADQKADPTVLPRDEELHAGIASQLRTWLEAKLRGN
ncbi:MAG: hypothetical protein V1929_00355 [bacterium]